MPDRGGGVDPTCRLRHREEGQIRIPWGSQGWCPGSDGRIRTGLADCSLIDIGHINTRGHRWRRRGWGASTQYHPSQPVPRHGAPLALSAGGNRTSAGIVSGGRQLHEIEPVLRFGSRSTRMASRRLPPTQSHCEAVRHEDSAVRLAAVNCERSITERLNFDWLALLPEMLPYISELQEDDDENVERETLRWVQQIEDVTGESLCKASVVVQCASPSRTMWQ